MSPVFSTTVASCSYSPLDTSLLHACCNIAKEWKYITAPGIALSQVVVANLCRKIVPIPIRLNSAVLDKFGASAPFLNVSQAIHPS